MKSTSDYYQIDVPIDEKQSELLFAKLSILDIESFVVEDDKIAGYLPVANFDNELENELNFLAKEFKTSWSKTMLPAQNWNQVWESNFNPILIDNFCHIIADFHPSLPNVQHEIKIQPEMAFGTGHHETTYMRIKSMKSIDFTNKTVFDYGCGTGILAILAEKMGAKEIEAIDYDEIATENTLVQIKKNDCQRIKVKTGTLEVSKGKKFEIILANINRTIILESLESLYDMLEKDGIILFSGILNADKSLVIEAAMKCGFTQKRKYHLNEWICLHLNKS